MMTFCDSYIIILYFSDLTLSRHAIQQLFDLQKERKFFDNRNIRSEFSGKIGMFHMVYRQ